MPSIDLPRKDETPKTFFNPINKDFTMTYRDEYTNQEKTYTLQGLKQDTQPSWFADLIIKNLTDFTINQRELKSDDENREKVKSEILV
jgi:hypothetical protein